MVFKQDLKLDTTNKIFTLNQLINVLNKYKDAYGGDITVDMLFDNSGIDTITRVEETYTKNGELDSICIIHDENDIYKNF